MIRKAHIKKLKKTFQHDDWPTCKCDVVNNVYNGVKITRLPKRMKTFATERLQTVFEA